MSDGVEYPVTFHTVTTTGIGRQASTVTELFPVTTMDPRLLGDPPVADNYGACSYCRRAVHWLDGVVMTRRAFHRFDLSPAGGYYADELTAGAR